MERIRSLTDASLAGELNRLERVMEILTGADLDTDDRVSAAVELPRRSLRGRVDGESSLAA